MAIQTAVQSSRPFEHADAPFDAVAKMAGRMGRRVGDLVEQVREAAFSHWGREARSGRAMSGAIIEKTGKLGDFLKGKWHQVKGSLRSWFGDLTDNDVPEINGDCEKLYGKRRERYGWDQNRAEMETNRHLMEYDSAYQTS